MPRKSTPQSTKNAKKEPETPKGRPLSEDEMDRASGGMASPTFAEPVGGKITKR